MAATGFAWLLGLVGASDIPLLFAFGNVIGTLYFATAVHMLLSAPDGRLHTPWERRLAASVYGVSLLVLPLRPLRRPARIVRMRRVPGEHPAHTRERNLRDGVRPRAKRGRTRARDRGAGDAGAALPRRGRAREASLRAAVRGREGADGGPAPEPGAVGGRVQQRRRARGVGRRDDPACADAVRVPRRLRASAHAAGRRRGRADRPPRGDAAAGQAARRARGRARRSLARARLLAARRRSLRRRGRQAPTCCPSRAPGVRSRTSSATAARSPRSSTTGR